MYRVFTLPNHSNTNEISLIILYMKKIMGEVISKNDIKWKEREKKTITLGINKYKLTERRVPGLW